MRRKRRTFSQEFKRESVALVADHGYSYAEAGRSLDIDAKLVGRWHRELAAADREAFPGKGKLPPMQRRIRDLEYQVDEFTGMIQHIRLQSGDLGVYFPTHDSILNPLR